MPQFGLKLGVHEKDLASVVEILWREKCFDFLELYVPYDVEPESSALWEWYDGVLVLHAPHAAGGFNFAKYEMAAGNAGGVARMEALRERMMPGMVVFHPGLDGEIEDLFRQIADLKCEYPDLHRVMLLENKPRLGLGGEHCLGSSPEEMRRILAETGCGFCLDVRHAFAYAAWAGLEWRGVIGGFAEIKPRLWHAADGDVTSHIDSHGHIGEGTMPWEEISEFWNDLSLITIECIKAREKKLKDFLQDIALLHRRTERA
jgi:endonuclease IV